MAGRGTQARRWLIGALVAVNALMFLVFIGAAGAVSQALRAIDVPTVQACGQRAADQVVAGYLTTGTPRFDGEDTIRFRATDPDDVPLTVTCTLAEPDPDADGPLEILDAEVTP